MSVWVEIKNALNSTLGTSNFLSLDKILSGGSVTFSTPGQYTFTVPTAVRCLKITACGGGGGGGGGSYNGGGGGGAGGGTNGVAGGVSSDEQQGGSGGSIPIGTAGKGGIANGSHGVPIAATAGTVGCGGGGGSRTYNSSYVVDGGKGGDGYVEIEWGMLA
mgnify:CR=1 FL=1